MRRRRNTVVSFYETVVGQVRKISREARGMGVERFFRSGDFNVEVGIITEDTEFAGLI